MDYKETEVGRIPTYWNVYQLSDIGEIVGGGTPKTKVDEYWNGDIPWITPKDLSGFTDRYIYSGERNITKIGLDKSSAKLLPKNTVLFSSRAPIGYVAIAGNELTTNQGFKSIICNENNAYPLFIYYLLKSKKESIENIAGGSTFKEISGKAMKEFKVQVPPISEQRAIAKILSALDEKIETNNRINEKLEEMAQALFKHWFVDFEFPNENGEPYKSSGGEMMDSELGMIPKGWEITQLGELIDVIDNRGKTPPLSKDKTNFPIIDVKALSGTERIINYDNCTKFVDKTTYDSWFRSGHPKTGDILLSTVGSIGELKIFYGDIGCIAQNVVALRVKNLSYLYLYQYLQHIKGELISYNIGSVQPSIKITHVKNHEILVPQKDIEELFNKNINKLSLLIFNNSSENKKLSLIRETLLPKLMSGEIRVSLDE